MDDVRIAAVAGGTSGDLCWAREKSLLELISLVRKQGLDDKSDGRQRTQRESQRYQQSQTNDRENRRVQSSLERTLSRFKDNREKFLEQSAAHFKAASPFKFDSKGLAKIPEAINKMVHFSDGLFKMFGIGFGLFALLKNVAGAAMDVYDTFVDLRKVGVIAQNFMDFSEAAGVAGMDLKTFSELVKTNSGVIAAMASETDSGVKRFASLRRTVADNILTYRKLMLTSDDLNTYLTDYLDVQKASNLIRGMNEQDTADAATSFLLSVDNMALALGKSRDEIVKSFKQTASDISIRTFKAINPQMQKGVDTMLVNLSSAFGDVPGVMDAFTQMLTAGVTNNQDFWRITSQLGPGVYNAFQNMIAVTKDTSATQQDFDRVTIDMIKSTQQLSDGQIQQLLAMSQFDPQMKGVLEMMMAARTQFGKTGDEIERTLLGARERRELQSKTAENIMAVNQTLEMFMNTLKGAVATFIKSVFGDSTDAMNKNMSALIEKIQGWGTSLAQMMADGSLEKTLNDLFSNLFTKAISLMVDSVKSYFGLSTAADDLNEAIAALNDAQKKAAESGKQMSGFDVKSLVDDIQEAVQSGAALTDENKKQLADLYAKFKDEKVTYGAGLVSIDRDALSAEQKKFIESVIPKAPVPEPAKTPVPKMIAPEMVKPSVPETAPTPVVQTRQVVNLAHPDTATAALAKDTKTAVATDGVSKKLDAVLTETAFVSETKESRRVLEDILTTLNQALRVDQDTLSAIDRLSRAQQSGMY